ncbi:hypothetical protein B7P43_G15671 [Cryptotermes secundus]|uniref:Uncharacterized protein n=1 Tax=Cryptotermes secundus TaxID=105785 RepID=A0A2J7RQT8_9NEOP|nr:hypothetical protein B7P43_G15671 [Cryptotermes secundus]
MVIPKIKVFIYALTFLGYAWSCYGSGIISNLRDAVLAAEHVFGDIFENIITVAKKFKIVKVFRIKSEVCDNNITILL